MYIYNDEDNVPMNQEAFDQNGHNPTVYSSYAEMKACEQPLPFTDGPENGCWNCLHYNGDYCTILWNNLDECYLNTERDERDPDDHCDDWELDKTVTWEDTH